MGATGNSGVILSQLWRGFARGVDEETVLDASGIARAFALGRDTAYKGVVRPVEGTILTVAKDVASAADEGLRQGENIVQILERIVTHTLLTKTGLLVVEHTHTFTPQPEIGEELILTRSHHIGDTALSFYQPVREE